MYKCILCDSKHELQYDEHSKLYYCEECRHFFTKEELEQDQKNTLKPLANICLISLCMIPIIGLIVYLVIESSEINHKQRVRYTELFLAVLALHFAFILLNLTWYKYYRADLITYTVDKLRYVATKNYITENHLPRVDVPVIDDLIEKSLPTKSAPPEPVNEPVSTVIHNDLLDYDKYWLMDDAIVSGTRVLEIMDSLEEKQYVCLVQTEDIRRQRGDVYRNYGLMVEGSELAVSRFNLYYIPKQNVYDVHVNEDGTMEYISFDNMQKHNSIGWIRSAFTYRVNLALNSNGEIVGLMFTEIE